LIPERGIGQAFSWGPVERFELVGTNMRVSRSSKAEGLTRLMALCYRSTTHRWTTQEFCEVLIFFKI